MKRYVVSRAANRDLDRIWIYIAAKSEDAAESFLSKLLGAFEFLGDNPRLGRTRPELLPTPAMFWPVGDYLIIYRIKPGGVQIIAVAHAAQDIPTSYSSRVSGSVL